MWVVGQMVGLLQASRDYVISQMMLAVTEIIRAVESQGFRDELEPGYIASSMDTVCYCMRD